MMDAIERTMDLAIAAKFEHTILVTRNEPIILRACKSITPRNEELRFAKV